MTKKSKLAALPLLLDASALWSPSSPLTSCARHGQRKRLADSCWAGCEPCKARKRCIRRRCFRRRHSHDASQCNQRPWACYYYCVAAELKPRPCHRCYGCGGGGGGGGRCCRCCCCCDCGCCCCCVCAAARVDEDRLRVRSCCSGGGSCSGSQTFSFAKTGRAR